MTQHRTSITKCLIAMTYLLFSLVGCQQQQSLNEPDTLTSPTEQELSSVLPSLGSSFECDRTPELNFVLEITKNGSVYVSGHEIDQLQLTEFIKQAKTNNKKISIIVDSRAQLKDVMPILEQITHYGVKDWGMMLKYDES